MKFRCLPIFIISIFILIFSLFLYKNEIYNNYKYSLYDSESDLPFSRNSQLIFDFVTPEELEPTGYEFIEL